MRWIIREWIQTQRLYSAVLCSRLSTLLISYLDSRLESVFIIFVSSILLLQQALSGWVGHWDKHWAGGDLPFAGAQFGQQWPQMNLAHTEVTLKSASGECWRWDMRHGHATASTQRWESLGAGFGALGHHSSCRDWLLETLSGWAAEIVRTCETWFD